MEDLEVGLGHVHARPGLAVLEEDERALVEEGLQLGVLAQAAQPAVLRAHFTI